jgi:hypothetical protein
MSPRSSLKNATRIASVAVASLVACFGFSFASAGCAEVDTAQITDVQGPSIADFQAKGVSNFLEARCGSLDCHGQLGRPLRIFGRTGLRLADNPDAVSGGVVGTTSSEIVENYLAVVGLQPEVLRRVVEGAQRVYVDNEVLSDKELADAAPERLLLVTKPRDQVNHRGGAVIAVDGPGDKCLIAWLTGDPDNIAKEKCAEAQKFRK